MPLNRRSFVQTLTATGALCATGCRLSQANRPDETKILFGVCASSNKAQPLKAVGYDYIEGGVSPILKPDLPDDAYAPEFKKLKACALPIRSCNGFIPSTFRLTGPETSHDSALVYAVKVCQRADALGIPFIVLGSGGARTPPDGFDPARARTQFVDFCRKLGDRIANNRVTIVLEPLTKGETNILNSVTEGIGYVDEIDRPRIRLLADFYHMMKENEGPEAIRKAGSRIRHCHIAELEGRKCPGTKGEDFSGFFRALRDIGYSGGVSCECGWPQENVEAAWKKALRVMREQSKA